MDESIYKAWNTLLKLLAARGYDVEDYSNFSFSQVSAMHEERQLDLFVSKGEQKMFVKFNLDNRPHFETFEDDFFKGDPPLLTPKDDLLIVIKDDLNESTKAQLDRYWNDGYYLMVVGLRQLQFNVLEHKLVPRHEVLTPAEYDEIAQKYRVRDLPEISRYDPVAIAIGLRPGQIVRIKRKSKTALWSEKYSLCI